MSYTQHEEQFDRAITVLRKYPLSASDVDWLARLLLFWDRALHYYTFNPSRTNLLDRDEARSEFNEELRKFGLHNLRVQIAIQFFWED